MPGQTNRDVPGFAKPEKVNSFCKDYHGGSLQDFSPKEKRFLFVCLFVDVSLINCVCI